MFKSKSISVRFSKDELTQIDDFRIQLGIKTKNDFFRYASAFYIAMIEAMTRIATSKEINSELDAFNEDIKNELDKVPSTEANLRGKYKLIEKTILPKIEQEIDKGAEFVKPFAKKRASGRPSKPKAKPGRPKDTGYKK